MGRQLDLRHITQVGELGSDATVLAQSAVHIVLEGRTNLTRLVNAVKRLRDISVSRHCLRGPHGVRLPITGHIRPGEHRLSNL